MQGPAPERCTFLNVHTRTLLRSSFLYFPEMFISAARAATSAVRGAEPVMKAARYFPFSDAPAALNGYAGSSDGFDPLRLSEKVDIRWLREAELKHGRIAMLAVVGFIVPDAGLWSLDNGINVPSIYAHDACVASGPYGGQLGQVLLFVSVIELLVGLPAVWFMMFGGERKPGDFAFDPLGLRGSTSDEAMEVKELKHGRLAMLSFGAIITQAAFHPEFPYF